MPSTGSAELDSSTARLLVSYTLASSRLAPTCNLTPPVHALDPQRSFLKSYRSHRRLGGSGPHAWQRATPQHAELLVSAAAPDREGIICAAAASLGETDASLRQRADRASSTVTTARPLHTQGARSTRRAPLLQRALLPGRGGASSGACGTRGPRPTERRRRVSGAERATSHEMPDAALDCRCARSSRVCR